MYDASAFKNFSKERIAKLFEQAVESGMTDWCISIKPFEEKKPTDTPFDFYRRMSKGFFLVDDDGKKYKVKEEDISNALEKMQDEYEEDFISVVKREETPMLCDSFLQLCVFRQVYYS